MIFAYFCSTLGHLAGQEETSPISNKAVGNGQCLGWGWRRLAYLPGQAISELGKLRQTTLG